VKIVATLSASTRRSGAKTPAIARRSSPRWPSSFDTSPGSDSVCAAPQSTARKREAEIYAEASEVIEQRYGVCRDFAQIRECDLFIFALAPEALDSYACKLEYTYAFHLYKTILPILVAEGVSINLLPPTLSNIQFVDYRSQDRQSAFALVKALSNLPTPQPLREPLPKPPEVPISYLGNLKDQIDTRATLSFQEQTALLLKLKERLVDVNEFDDVLNLLRRLRKRG